MSIQTANADGRADEEEGRVQVERLLPQELVLRRPRPRASTRRGGACRRRAAGTGGRRAAACASAASSSPADGDAPGAAGQVLEHENGERADRERRSRRRRPAGTTGRTGPGSRSRRTRRRRAPGRRRRAPASRRAPVASGRRGSFDASMLSVFPRGAGGSRVFSSISSAFFQSSEPIGRGGRLRRGVGPLERAARGLAERRREPSCSARAGGRGRRPRWPSGRPAGSAAL